MVRARVLRELRLAGGGHVSAGSGLARARGRLYVAADDELALAVFGSHEGPGTLLPLAAGDLPEESAARKAAKADLEAVVALPAGGLLVVGSGATEAHNRGFVVSLDGAAVEELDLAPLYDRLRAQVDGPLDVEGAAWHEGSLVLAHRGVGGRPSALARVRWPALSLASLEPLPPAALGDEPLGITDLAALPDGRLLASWAAEATDDPYLDGPVAGSALGVLGTPPQPLDGAWKVEGIWSDGREVLMVTDADDRARPSVLLRATLPADRPQVR